MKTPLQFPLSSRELPAEVRQVAECRHWCVFPAYRRGKYADAQSLIKNATCDVNNLEQLAFENPGCNWALATGPASGVFAIHADDESGAASFLSITMRYEEETDWSETLETAILGIPDCAFFQWPECMILRTASRIIASGLSIRGDENWVLIPPSTNIAGAKYNYRDPETPLATAPKWMIKKFFTRQNGQSSSNILSFPQFHAGRTTSAFCSMGSASGIILPFSTYARTAHNEGSRHRVQMLFHRSETGRWLCKFIDNDHQTTLFRTLSFSTTEKVIEASERGGALKSVKRRKALNQAIEREHGGIILELTEEQYSRLKTNK
jgi:hypothetical protein